MSKLLQTSDEGWILGGGSDSDISGDKKQPSLGQSDFWVVKLGPCPAAGTPCNDDNACTTIDIQDGNCNCIGTPLNCDDGNACTADSCDLLAGCLHSSINCSTIISGAILSETGAAITAVTLNLIGTGSPQTMTTAIDGLYNFNVSAGDNCSITPSKNNDVTFGNGISTLDILLMRAHILAIQPLNSPYKIIAADVNSSASITSLDLLFVRGLILGTSSSFPGGKLWAFVSSDFIFQDPQSPYTFQSARTYTNIQQSYSNQNFIGIKAR